MKIIKSSLALVVLLIVIITICSCEEENPLRNAKLDYSNKRAPSFRITDLSGITISLDALQGKVVFINFFATWCSPCRMEIPFFVDLYAKYHAQGFEIIGISIDQYGGTDLIKKFSSMYKINYPVGLLTEDIANKYRGITGVPTTLIIDKNGDINQAIVGPRSKEEFEKIITGLLTPG
ncbi:MAG: TlpA disulfide reductase family protein [Pseudomonadota bacterium]